MGDKAQMSSEGLLSTIEMKADPSLAALIVVDVQNDFVAEGGFFQQIGADVKRIQECVPRLARLIDAARAADVLVIFVQAIYDSEYLSAPMRERNFRRTVEMPRCLTGSWGADFYKVRPAPGEPVIVKHRYSAMLNTALPSLLEERGIKSLLLTGVSTDTCVESTGRDAYFLDHYVTIIADCCGAYSESDHTNALMRFDRDYGAVVSSQQVIEVWSRPARDLAHLGAAHVDA
jgi:ureidoacrylate peracid hydrolase